jgi:hypothetical protein
MLLFLSPPLRDTRDKKKNKNSFRAKEKLSPSVWLFVPYIKTHVKGHHPPEHFDSYRRGGLGA